MRILHTSDWHLGRQLHHVSLLEDQRHVLGQIVELVAARNVDVVLVSGDVYDRAIPPVEAIELLDETIEAISLRLGVPVILIAGNHDRPERLAAFSRPLARSGVYVRGPLEARPEPVALSDEHGEVAFYCLPYADPAAVRDVHGVELRGHEEAMAYQIAQIVARERDTGADAGAPGAETKGADLRSRRRCVVLAHCFLEGGEASESERPLSVGGIEKVSPRHFEGFSYAALGHLHAPQHKGAEHVRYSGSILKYSFSEERQKKSVTLVELDGEGRCSIEKAPLVPLRDVRVIEGRLDELLEQGRSDPKRDDYLMVRLLDTHAILDVMGKLRAVYPNVLHLERPALARGGQRHEISRDKLEHGHMPLFLDFYEQMTGHALDRSGAERVAEIFDRVIGEEP